MGPGITLALHPVWLGMFSALVLFGWSREKGFIHPDGISQIFLCFKKNTSHWFWDFGIQSIRSQLRHFVNWWGHFGLSQKLGGK